MIFNQKLFWLLLPCSLTSLSTISFSSKESFNQIQSKTEDKELSIEEELGIINKIGSSSSFLEFGDGSGTSSLEEVVKRYLKTTTGAKELSKRLTQHLIVNLIDSYKTTEPSWIKDRLQGKLTTLRSTSTLSSLGAKEKRDARFLFAGDETAYKDDKVLRKSRELFEPVLNEVLNNLSQDNSKSEFKFEHADPFIVLFAKFWNHVLDDYLKYERPIPFKKITWNYDTADRTKDIKLLFDNPDSSLPNKASYNFPFLSQQSSKKFQDFLKKIKDSNDQQKFEELSDEKNVDLVVPISSLIEGKYSSQFTTSILEVFHYLVSPIEEKGANQKYYKKFFLRNSDSLKEDKCESNINGIFETSIETIAKDPKDLFCVQKNNKGISDFVYLIQKQKQKQPSWILFRDKDGIHALTYNSEVFDSNSYDSGKLKKHLINKEDFNLKDKLTKYLNKNFERLILGYWDKFFILKQQQQQQQAKELSNFLLRDAFSQHLVQLRKALLKDYFEIFTLGKSNGWQNAFAGKFPYEFFQKQKLPMAIKKEEKAKDIFSEKMLSYLENAFLLDPTVSSRFAWALDSFLEVKTSFDKYSKSVDSLFIQPKEPKGQQKTWETFRFFKFDSGVNTINKGPFEINEIGNSVLLESIWASLRKDNKLAEVLFQEKIKSDIGYFDLINWSKKQELVDIYKSKFKGLGTKKNSEDLVLNYLHSEYIELTKDLSIPQILGDFDFDFEKINGDDKLKKYLEKIVKKFRSTLSSSASDVSKGGVLTDLFTIKWLAQDNFENFRKHLRNTLQKNSLSGFVFSKKFSEKDKCLPTTWEKSKISENLELKHVSQKPSSVFRSTSTNDEELTCLVSSDIVNFAKVTTSDNEVKYLTGYKGLVNTNWKDFFPEDIVNLLQNKTSLWKDTESLISYIDETVNSEHKYQELIEKFRTLFPNNNWDFNSRELCQKFNFDWQSGGKATCLSTNSLSFNEKKELLKKYLKNEGVLDKSGTNSYNGWVTDEKGNYLIKSKDGAEYQIYLVQIKYDDVKDQDSWTSYLKTIDSSYFFRKLIKVAKDPKMHKQALVSQLNSENGSLKRFKTGDDRLKRLLGYSWLNLKD